MATRPDELEEDFSDEEREFDVGEPDEVEVEVNDEETEEPEASEPEEPPVAEDEKPKPRFRADRRITELARAKAEAEARAAALEQQLRERDELLNTERVANFKAMETGLAAELAAAKRKLADAHTLGDYQAIADATEEVSRLAADLSAVKVYASQPQARQPQVQQQPQAAPQVKVEPRTQAWIEQNPWFTPNSPEYEPELAVDAQAFAKKLEIRLQREGRHSEIGGQDYFRQIDEYMAKAYPDVFELEPAPAQRKMPAMKASQEVAAASRQSPAAAPAKKGNIIKLTAQEKEMAERFHPNLPPQKAWAEYAKWK